MINLKAIGKRIQDLRKNKKLTQKNIADAVNVTEKYISNIENGHSISSWTVLLGIANVLDASIDYILGDELNYNKIYHPQGEHYNRLMNEISYFDEDECADLADYVVFMRKQRNNRME